MLTIVLKYTLKKHTKNQVLVDDATKLLTAGALAYTALPPLTLKGIDGLVPVFTPLDAQSKASSRDTDLALRYLQGDIERLRGMVTAPLAGITIVLTGDRGSGKSILVDVRADGFLGVFFGVF